MIPYCGTTRWAPRYESVTILGLPLLLYVPSLRVMSGVAPRASAISEYVDASCAILKSSRLHSSKGDLILCVVANATECKRQCSFPPWTSDMLLNAESMSLSEVTSQTTTCGGCGQSRVNLSRAGRKRSLCKPIEMLAPA